MIKAAGVLALMAAVGPAWSLVCFSGTNGSNLHASATFDLVGNKLVVVLDNNSTADALIPCDVLTAVFFDYDGGALPLTCHSAVLTPGSSVLFGTADPGGVVGGEWAYGSALSGAPRSARNGISSAGFGLFGAATFPGNDLHSPNCVNGLNYGITSLGDDPSTGNQMVTGGEPLIRHSVTFTFTGLPIGFDLSKIGNVSFQYGTALDEPNFPGNRDTSGEPAIPGPAAAVPFALGFFAALRKRRA